MFGYAHVSETENWNNLYISSDKNQMMCVITFETEYEDKFENYFDLAIPMSIKNAGKIKDIIRRSEKPMICEDNKEKVGLKNLRVPITISLGDGEIDLETLNNLGEGSVLEINTKEGDAAYLKSGNTVIGRGEVLIVDEHFGIRVTEIFKEKK